MSDCHFESYYIGSTSVHTDSGARATIGFIATEIAEPVVRTPHTGI